MKMEFLVGNLYLMQIYKTYPRSRMLDFDYGDDKRYVSTYINHMVLLDPIIRTEQLHIVYPDITVSDIQNALNDLCDNLEYDNIGLEQRMVSYSIDIPRKLSDLSTQITIRFIRTEHYTVRLDIIFAKKDGCDSITSIDLSSENMLNIYTALDDIYDVTLEDHMIETPDQSYNIAAM